MKQILIIILSFIYLNSLGQDFKFNVYFEDAKRNKDSITIGYDKIASDSIDSSFNEINIIDKPLDSLFDVRISNVFLMKGYNQKIPYSTKRQIGNYNCGGWFKPMTIDIFCKNWPITISWDSTLFKDSCRYGSLFTSWHPGGWFDVGGGFITLLNKKSSMKLHRLVMSDQSTYSDNTQYYYINTKNDTIYVFWQAFGDSTLPHLDTRYLISDDFNFYPNPSHGLFFLNGKIQDVKTMRIYNLSGREIKTTNYQIINLQGYSNGIYVVKIILKNDCVITKKIINKR